MSFLANASGDDLSWSPDGTFLLFDTGQRTEDGQIARVDLLPRTPRFREDQFRDLFQPEPTRRRTPTAPTPDDARDPQDAGRRRQASRRDQRGRREAVRDRLRRHPPARSPSFPLGLDVGAAARSARTARRLVDDRRRGGQANLYTWSLDELATEPPVARQLTPPRAARDRRSSRRTARRSSTWRTARSRPSPSTLDKPRTHRRRAPRWTSTSTPRSWPSSTRPGASCATTSSTRRCTASTGRRVRARYRPRDRRRPHPRRAAARSLSLMIGELNASHSGINAPAGVGRRRVHRPPRPALRPRGVRAAGRLRVTRGHAARARPPSRGGSSRATTPGGRRHADRRRAPISTQLLDLQHRPRRSRSRVRRPRRTAQARDVAVRPVDAAHREGARSIATGSSRTAPTWTRISGGRLGYVHMPDMGRGVARRSSIVDLDAENQRARRRGDRRPQQQRRLRQRLRARRLRRGAAT